MHILAKMGWIPSYNNSSIVLYDRAYNKMNVVSVSEFTPALSKYKGHIRTSLSIDIPIFKILLTTEGA